MENINLKCLQSLATVVLCVVMSMAFCSCSKDDESANDNLISTIIGTWEQDGDNDILVINADGTGVGYENPTDYKNNCEGYKLKWEYKDGWVYITIDFYGKLQQEKLRVLSLSEDRIVWKNYDEEVDADGNGYSHDPFGYYDLWTWERYKEKKI